MVHSTRRILYKEREAIMIWQYHVGITVGAISTLGSDFSDLNDFKYSINVFESWQTV